VVYVAKYLKNHSSVGRKKPVSAQEADE
jgi:hypothetical protein